jgi:hypothetical protein
MCGVVKKLSGTGECSSKDHFDQDAAALAGSIFPKIMRLVDPWNRSQNYL